MQILELASNITLRLFLRPFEAVLSFKSLFEGVPDHRLSSYFTWLNIFAPRFPWDHFWGCRDILKFRGRSRPFEAEAIWGWGHLRLRPNVLTTSKMVSWKPGRKNIQPCKIWAQCDYWPQPQMASSNLRISKCRDSLKNGLMETGAQKYSAT